MKQLTVLVAPINAVGHVNACLGALEAFPQRGHRVIFLVDAVFQGKATARGYEEHIMVYPKDNDEEDSSESSKEENPGERIGQWLVESKVIGPWSVEEKMVNCVNMLHGEKNYRDSAAYDAAIRQCLELYKPDLVYIDHMFLPPSVHLAGTPWVFNASAVPACYLDYDEEDDCPPGGSGYPSGPVARNNPQYAAFNVLRRTMFCSPQFNDFIEKDLGYGFRYPGDALRPETQLLTVYSWPEEINFRSIQSRKGWFNLDVFDRRPQTQKSFKKPLEELLPKKFLEDQLEGGKFSGSLVYLSMGSMGGYDLDLLRRLIRILGSKSPHKYIVSKGPRHEELEELPRNMWGDRYVDQMAILPHVDLVITHGGNNTTTETFSLGKPMVLLGMFGDQFDNAQRLHETGYGRRIDPYNFTDEQLLEAVDDLLVDDVLKTKLANASRRIQTSRKHEELVEKIEQLLG